MESVQDLLASHAELTIERDQQVTIHLGNLSVVALGFQRVESHERLAWITTDHDGGGMMIDTASIYAVEDVTSPPP